MPTSTSNPDLPDSDVRQSIIDRLYAEGFDSVAVTTPDEIPLVGERLSAFLAAERHGDMDWLAECTAWRAAPKVMWPDVKSIFMVGLNYGPDHDPLGDLEQTDRGVISVYARNRDYHDLIKKRLKRVGRWLSETHGTQLKVFVDTAPVAEKPLAESAGMGWQGKHTNMVSRDFGSWLFLGAIFTTLETESDKAGVDHCGSCQQCIDICPTKAFPAPYQLDARRCISYLTIEHKGHIPVEFREAMGNRIYGCDDCLAVCPWNKYAVQSREQALHSRAYLNAPLLTELAALDDAAFREFFSGSPIKRTGRNRFVRNVLIALGNAGDPASTNIIASLLTDDSALVRAMAVWALKRVASTAQIEVLSHRHLPREADSEVRSEWARAVQPAAHVVHVARQLPSGTD
ncbi:MAG: tRNA epoxyqueuosine(34) reductase QueG [Proteobacteria bacterium]|nr:tRNA epoxyqueuosine(34) reductase QueG [Pseudomonadota bacterium]